MKGIMKIVKSLEDSGLPIKKVSKTIQNEAKEQKSGFLGMFLGTLGTSLLGTMLKGRGLNRAGDGIIRTAYAFKRSSKNKYFWFQIF